MPSEEGLSVVVPVFNSAATLDDLVARLRPVLEASAARFELVLVNDASGAAWEKSKKLF